MLRDARPLVPDHRLYVGTNGGTVHALDADGNEVAQTTTEYWSFASGDGPVKGYVFPVRQSKRLYFATTNKVWALDDNGPTAANPWNGLPGQAVSVPSASVVMSGTHVYVGADYGRLYQIDNAGNKLCVQLGDGTARLGTPAIDFQNSMVYVGSENGLLHAVAVPLTSGTCP